MKLDIVYNFYVTTYSNFEIELKLNFCTTISQVYLSDALWYFMIKDYLPEDYSYMKLIINK